MVHIYSFCTIQFCGNSKLVGSYVFKENCISGNYSMLSGVDYTFAEGIRGTSTHTRRTQLLFDSLYL